MITKPDLDCKLRALGPGLLKPAYRKIWTAERPTTGYCYLVSEALYHFQFPRSASYIINLGPRYGTHWWIRDASGEIVDWTGDQFDFPVPYAEGRRAAFFRGSVRTTRGFISANGFLLAKYLRLS